MYYVALCFQRPNAITPLTNDKKFIDDLAIHLRMGTATNLYVKIGQRLPIDADGGRYDVVKGLARLLEPMFEQTSNGERNGDGE